jgi:excisionase family DNA binding protein
MTTSPALLRLYFGNIPETEIHSRLESFWDRCAADSYIPPRPTQRAVKRNRRPALFKQSHGEIPRRFAYSIEETCAALGIGRGTVFKLIRDGKLPARKLGTRTLIPAEDLERLVANLPDAKA